MPPRTSPPRALFYIQHLLGIGHLKRAATLARGLDAAGFSLTVVSGGMAVPGIDVGGARFVQLPPARATDIYFKQLVDEYDRPIGDEWRARRGAALAAAYDEADPEIFLTELFPFGRRQLGFELLPLLETARSAPRPPLVVCSVRDILVESPKPARTVEMLDRVRRLYDLVLVHGDPGLIPFEATFPHATEIADKLAYTGYVVDRTTAGARPPGPPEVLVSAGGGAVSEPLLVAALEARSLCSLSAEPWRFLVGHNLAQERFAALVARAPAGVVVERARPDFTTLLARCRLSISQGGYNTVMEVLDAGARAVVVPYAGGYETEQTLRARLLAERGALQIVGEEELGPQRIAEAIERSLATPPGGLKRIDTDGVAATVRLLDDALRARSVE